MQTYIALLRGINVGGRNKLKMAELKALLADLSFTNVVTYIQSGNVVFQSERGDVGQIGADIRAAVEKDYGFAPKTLVLTLAQFNRAIENNPYPNGEESNKTVHFFFLAEAAVSADIQKLTSLKAASEQFHLTDEVFYLYAPDGVSRSKLMARAEKTLGVAATARNWRTVCKLAVMVADLD